MRKGGREEQRIDATQAVFIFLSERKVNEKNATWPFLDFWNTEKVKEWMSLALFEFYPKFFCLFDSRHYGAQNVREELKV